MDANVLQGMIDKMAGECIAVRLAPLDLHAAAGEIGEDDLDLLRRRIDRPVLRRNRQQPLILVRVCR